jgi:spore germination cell wall hydrolase CwlJ-like protein
MTNGWYQSASRATNYWRKDIDMKGWMYELEIIGTIGNHMFAKPKEGTR